VSNADYLGLCQRAGFPQPQLAQVHGDFFSMKCSKYQSQPPCDYVVNISYPVSPTFTLPADVDISDPNVPLPEVANADLPRCPNCSNLLRPNVVLFGESTPTTITERIYKFTSAGPIDLMLVVGTSAIVLPAAMYIPIARNAEARVAFFNLEESDEEVGRIWADDWFFEGDAAVTVAEMLKGVVGTVQGSKLGRHASRLSTGL
jgi:NAD-dependent deacetylase sirtuin 5